MERTVAAASQVEELEQLRQRVSDLELRNEELADFLDEADIPVHCVGPDGVILWANQAELNLVGYDEAEYVGRHISEFHVEESTSREMLARIAAASSVRNFEARLRSKDGSIRHVLISSHSRGGSHGFAGARCFTKDITDRKRTEQRLSLQFAVSRLLTQQIDAARAAQEIVRTIGEHLDFAVAGWWEPDSSERELRCTALWRRSESEAQELIEDTLRRRFPRGTGLPGLVWARRTAVWVMTIERDAHLPRGPLALAAGLHTAIGVPVSDGGETVGVMEFFSADHRAPDAQLLEALTSAGRDIGQFLARRRAEHALAARAEQVQVLYELAAALATAESAENIYHQALATLERSFGVTRSSVLLFDNEGVMRFRFWRGISDEYRRAVDGHSPWKRDAQSPEPILVADVGTAPDIAPWKATFDREGIGALAFIPLVTGGRLIGKFMLYYRQPHEFTESEVSLARTIANHVAIAIERWQADTEMKEQQTRLSLALQAANTGVWEWDIAANRVTWSDRVYEIHGLARGSISGIPVELRQYFHPDDRDSVSNAVLEALKSRSSYQVDLRILRPDGQVRWIATSGRVVCNEQNEPVRLIGTTVDITDRKHSEAALRESSETVAALLESASQAIISVDETGRIAMLNAMADRMFGYERHELLGAPLELLVPERMRERHAGHRALFSEAPKSRPMGAGLELMGRRKDGTEFPLEISLSSISTRQGRLAVSFITDISTRRHADEQLRQSEARYRTLFEHSNDALGVSAGERFEYVNAAFARMFGYERPEDIVGMSIYDTVPDASADAIRRNRAERSSAGSLQPMLFKSIGRRRDGTEFASEVRATDFWMDGKLYTLAILRDVTAERQAEEALAKQAGELARSNADLQQFAFATSHDLQEPLRNIASFAQLLARRYEGRLDADADEFIQTIVAGCHRMETLIRDLLAFSRVANSEDAPPAVVDMNVSVRWAINNLEASVRESGAEITVEHLPAVRGDRVQLVQLLQNLVGNAIKYRREKPQIAITATQRDGKWRFAVKDNGIGIASEYHDRIFGLFKRLHGRDIPGTGVGLAICRKIVEKHGGEIWVESVYGSGSTFLFTLPDA